MTAPETPVASAREAAQQELRVWSNEHAGYGQRVRTEIMRGALSAILRRSVIFGMEDGFGRYRSRELLLFQGLSTGTFTDYLGRTALARAIAEDERAVIDAFAASHAADDLVAWFAAYDHSDPERALALLAGVSEPEERATARLVVARRHAQLAEAAWLWQVPAEIPQVAIALCAVFLARRPDLVHAVHAWLIEHRTALFCVEPDELLAPLVLASAEHPQVTLQPFAEMYGEQTVCAAAEWHLEHAEPQAALDLAARVRPLSRWADQAQVVRGLALIALRRSDEAGEALATIDDPACADLLALRLAEVAPARVGDAAVAAIAARCRADQPERFVACLKVLLGRRELTTARTLAAQRQGDFTHPQAQAVIAAILAPGAAKSA